MERKEARRDALYEEAVERFGTALGRLANAYERDAHRRQDLLQEIHLALWRSFADYAERCSLRTWVYRVAHNTASSYALRKRRAHSDRMVGLDEIGGLADPRDPADLIDQRHTLGRLMGLIQTLKPLDREVILLYLEDLDAATIAEITGLTPGAVATKVHRIKAILASRFNGVSP